LSLRKADYESWIELQECSQGLFALPIQKLDHEKSGELLKEKGAYLTVSAGPLQLNREDLLSKEKNLIGMTLAEGLSLISAGGSTKEWMPYKGRADLDLQVDPQDCQKAQELILEKDLPRRLIWRQQETLKERRQYMRLLKKLCQQKSVN
jgi:hypothetical protein